MEDVILHINPKKEKKIIAIIFLKSTTIHYFFWIMKSSTYLLIEKCIISRKPDSLNQEELFISPGSMVLMHDIIIEEKVKRDSYFFFSFLPLKLAILIFH